MENFYCKNSAYVWEQRKLNKLASIYDGIHQTPHYVDKGIMFLSVENIETLTSDKYITVNAFEKNFKVSPQKGDVLMTRIGNVGTANLKKDNVPNAYYVSLALIRSGMLNPSFLKGFINSAFGQKEIWKRTLHVAFPKKINKNEIGELPINFPNYSEQQRIGYILTYLESIIASNQHHAPNCESYFGLLNYRI